MKNEMIIHNYIAVAALIKWAKQMKRKIEVERCGNDVAGVYWKVKIHETR